VPRRLRDDLGFAALRVFDSNVIRHEKRGAPFEHDSLFVRPSALLMSRVRMIRGAGAIQTRCERDVEVYLTQEGPSIVKSGPGSFTGACLIEDQIFLSDNFFNFTKCFCFDNFTKAFLF
jgi:hypothetical protein